MKGRVASAAALVLFLSGGTFVFPSVYVSAWGQSGEGGNESVQSARQQEYFYALSDFVNRSPGERGEIDLVKGKGPRSSAILPSETESSGPSQRALGKIFEPDSAPILGSQEIPLGAPVVPLDEVASLGTLPSPEGGAPGGPGPGAGFLPGNFIFAPQIPSGGGSDDDVTPVVPPPPPVGAVPEPDTWALLMIGFFLTGFAIRRTRGRYGRLVLARP